MSYPMHVKWVYCLILKVLYSKHLIVDPKISWNTFQGRKNLASLIIDFFCLNLIYLYKLQSFGNTGIPPLMPPLCAAGTWTQGKKGHLRKASFYLEWAWYVCVHVCECVHATSGRHQGLAINLPSLKTFSRKGAAKTTNLSVFGQAHSLIREI